MPLIGMVLILSGAADVLLGVSERSALTGIVSSETEGPMEGVLVSAKRVGGTINLTVVSDKHGRYSFPASRLMPAEYQLSIRAVGYEAAVPRTVTVGKNKSEADIKLDKAVDLASQLSDVEWLMSIPGTDEQKRKLFISCDLCHSLAPILKSTYGATAWMTTLVRMHNWSAGSLLSKPIASPFRAEAQSGDAEFAKYLSSINLSSRSTHDFELKTLPRPHGDDTKVIVTEYDLPRSDAEPHDSVVDAEGMVWYGDYAEAIVGRLNPHTGEVKEWQDPLVKPGYNGGFLDVELDREGNPWVGRHGVGFNGFAKFDKKAEKFVDWSDPIEPDKSKMRIVLVPFIAPGTSTGFIDITRDGKVWSRDSFSNEVFRFDPVTGTTMTFDQFPPEIMSKDYKGPRHRTYSIRTDSKGNLYEADIDGGNIFRVDGVTGKVTMYPTPTPESGPRRMHMDSEDRLWIGEYYAEKIVMFDTRIGQFQEWSQPIPWYGPYDVAPDKNGNLWTGSMSSDLITRFTPKTGEFRHYLLPSLDTNMRRADVDNSSPRPMFWMAESHRGKIAKVEPLE